MGRVGEPTASNHDRLAGPRPGGFVIPPEWADALDRHFPTADR
ncbi:hypothetical protein [Nonomuraea sp. NPDC050786]